MRQNFRKTTCICIGIILSLTCVVHAQQYLSPGYVLSEIAGSIGMRPTPENVPNFVVKARPDPNALEYTPLKPPPRDFHSEDAKVSNRLLAESGTIAELEAARSVAQSRAVAAKSSLYNKSTPANRKEGDGSGSNWPPPPWSND
jgi:hypothetical protein